MVQLFEQDIKTNDRQSSKGNQLKWCRNNVWYKADYMGYEGLVEYVVSRLLEKSSLKQEEYVLYKTEEISYKRRKYLGCKSENFLPEGWQLITLERLFYGFYNESLYKKLFTIPEHSERLEFIVDQTERITGISDFGKYMSKILAIDTFFMNEDNVEEAVEQDLLRAQFDRVDEDFEGQDMLTAQLDGVEDIAESGSGFVEEIEDNVIEENYIEEDDSDGWGSIDDNPYYNDNLDMDQQSPEFWDNL